MDTDLHHQIRKHVNQYLTKTIGLDRLHRLTMPIILNVKGDEDTIFLNDVYRIELLFAEHTGGYLTENKFRNELAATFSIKETGSV
jgi:hypothetical protein